MQTSGKYLLAIFAAISLVASLQFAMRSTVCTNCIASGRGVGALALGDTYSRMEEVWGTAEQIAPDEALLAERQLLWAYYPKRGVSVAFSKSQGLFGHKYVVTHITLLDAGSYAPNITLEPVHFERFSGLIQGELGIGASRSEIDMQIGGLFLSDGDSNPENDVFNCGRAGLAITYENDFVVRITVKPNRSEGC